MEHEDKTSNAFESIDENLEEFKGTSSTLPQPVLVFKPKNDLHTYCFQIEVHNFIGSCIKIFPGRNYLRVKFIKNEIICNCINQSSSGNEIKSKYL